MLTVSLSHHCRRLGHHNIIPLTAMIIFPPPHTKKSVCKEYNKYKTNLEGDTLSSINLCTSLQVALRALPWAWYPAWYSGRYSTSYHPLALVQPPTREVQVANWCLKSLADPTRSPTDPTQAQCEQVEHRSCWVPSLWGSRWPCTFHVVCFIFPMLGMGTLPNANVVFSWIWP